MSWLKKILPSVGRSKRDGAGVPEGLWTKCEACGSILYRAELARDLSVCPKCDHHHRIPARERLQRFLDPESFSEIGEEVEPVDRLKFKDSKKYKDRISAAQKKTKERDALIAMRGKLHGMPAVACAFEFAFMGGSMGAVVGERFVLAAEASLKENAPLICFSASGGARMQEGLISLMQMAKTSAALAKLSDAGIPFVSVLTNPTMGGVSASLAMLGDVIVAEPNALIGFAGPRVIEQTVRETLPEGFQRSEFLLDHGAIDMIISRQHMRDSLARLLAKLQKKPEPAVA